MATDSPKPMSPTAAVARHLEWLEFALAAARDEEARRKGRLDKATPKNRDKRTVRLAEVSAEVVELSALVTGLKNLRGPGATARKPAAKPRASAALKPRVATAAKPRAATAASKPRAATASKPRATTARKTTRVASKPSTTRTRKPRPTSGTSPASASAATAPTGPTV
jgi:hypothetical protein